MTNTKQEVMEVLTGPERRRRWSSDEKLAMVRESLEPGKTVSMVARQHGVNPNQLFHWRKLYQNGSLSAVSAGEEVVPASVRDVMLAAVENRFGATLKAPEEIEWLTDNGSGYIAERTRMFATELGLKPLTTPVCSPQSNGMAESFVKTMKRDYIAFTPKPDAVTAVRSLAIAFAHYNEQHPNSALKYRSPSEFRRRTESLTLV